MTNKKFYTPLEEVAGSAVLEKKMKEELVAPVPETYQYDTTKELVSLVKEAGALISTKGEKAFDEFRVSGSRWRQEDRYIFVIDKEGNMLVHFDPAMEGKNQLELKDVNGKPIIKGLISAATGLPDKPYGWYHYEWPIPGGLLPRWKSSYVELVTSPSGKNYIVGSGVYNDRMEKEFVLDMVKEAKGLIEQKGEAAYPIFRDPKNDFMAKDAYIFVIAPDGVEFVNPAHPNLEGRNLMQVKDTRGRYFIKEALDLVKTKGSGWVDYMWPKPGEAVSTQKSSYVTKANINGNWVMVGAGVYLADAPKVIPVSKKKTAPELMELVRQAAEELQQKGEKAFPEFRVKGSKWFTDNTYLFVWTMDGTRLFNAGEPSGEGVNVSDMKDVLQRPVGKMFYEAIAAPSGEGWVHYMKPEPGDLFPVWKSSFVKKVTFPSGKEYLVGSGIYNMQMDKAFIEDLVNRASALVEKEGKDAFVQFRDKKGPFVFMDTYVFVNSPGYDELVNAAQPTMEGRYVGDIKDLKGKYLVKEYVDEAMQKGSAWVDYYWYRPGANEPSKKISYVRKVQHGNETYIVGAGIYEPE